MIFSIIKIICIIMAIFAVVTLWQAKIKKLGKVLGSVIVILIALGYSDANLATEIMYTLVNLVVFMVTIAFRIKLKRTHRL